MTGGAAEAATRLEPSPDAPKRFTTGTHRTCDPEETLDRLRPLLPAMGITRIANVTGLDRTGVEVACAIRPGGHVLQTTTGKAERWPDAVRSALGEAAELLYGTALLAEGGELALALGFGQTLGHARASAFGGMAALSISVARIQAGRWLRRCQ